MDKITEFFNFIKSDPFWTAVGAIVLGNLIWSIIKGIQSKLTNGNFLRGFLNGLKLLWQFSGFIISLSKLVLIFLLRPIVKPIVHEVLKDVPSTSDETIVLESTNIKDDCYYSTILNLRAHKYKIHLNSIEGSNWRIGFKLSKDQNFTQDRYSHNYPLIHLTKDSAENILRIDEYDQNGINRNLRLPILNDFDNYDNFDLSLVIYNDSQKNYLTMLNNDKSFHKYAFEYGEFHYSQLFAWGDKKPFKIKLKLEKLANKYK